MIIMTINDIIKYTLWQIEKNRDDKESQTRELEALLIVNREETLDEEIKKRIKDICPELSIYVEEEKLTSSMIVVFCKNNIDSKTKRLSEAAITTLFDAYKKNIIKDKQTLYDFATTQFTEELQTTLIESISEETIEKISQDGFHIEIRKLYDIVRTSTPINIYLIEKDPLQKQIGE